MTDSEETKIPEPSLVRDRSEKRSPLSDQPLRNFWYLALNGAQLKRGQVRGLTLVGDAVMVGRASDGQVFALRNICPHRGMPLHHGKFDGCAIECCYHGWKFGVDGHCTVVPSLLKPQDKYGDRISVKTYPCKEVQGNIWVFVGDRSPEGLPDVPIMPGIGDIPPKVHCTLRYPLNADNTAFTLMDPSHVAYVHSSAFVKRGAHALRDKVKDFEPVPYGWRVKRHPVPKENHIYKLFGKNATTEIITELPGRRIEHICGEKHSAVSLLLLTPISEEETEVHQSLYWTFTYLEPVRPIFHFLIRRFLNQDRHYALLQQEGLKHRPSMMLLGDGDAQALWFQRIKQTWLQAMADNKPFENPILPQTLRFRS
jgi:phenylpropionate dioxygenase-like ring-hydroxylating dioxygenase large terminal subunit